MPQQLRAAGRLRQDRDTGEADADSRERLPRQPLMPGQPEHARPRAGRRR